MQVTLTWGGVSKDLDLHILEPSNNTVNNENPTGDFGNLSADIKTGGGLGETYQTGCTNVTGQYVFAINYFEGQGPANGIVTITVGEQTETVQIPLIAAVG